MLLMDFPCTEDQLVPTIQPDSSFLPPVFEPQQSLPDFDSLLSDLSATFSLPECNSNTNIFGSITVDTNTTPSFYPNPQEPSPVHSMDSSHSYSVNEDVTFYDENVYIKQEPVDCAFHKLKTEQMSPVPVMVKQEPQMSLSLDQEFQTLDGQMVMPMVENSDPMMSDSPQQVQAMADVKKEMDSVCSLLNIPGDPYIWSMEQTCRWVEWVLGNYKFQGYYVQNFRMDGTNLCMMTQDAFKERCPEAGQYIYEELKIWRDTYSITASSSPVHEETQTYTDLEPVAAQRHSFLPSHLVQYNSGPSLDHIPRPVLSASPSLSPAPSVESLDSSTSSTHSFRMSPANSIENLSQASSLQLKSVTPGKHNIQLWQFLRELLLTPAHYGQCIRWLDRSKGIFKIEDSQRVARLWGQRKNRPAMNYDKLSRSIRQYYKKGIIKKTDNSKRLVYQFCQQYRV